MNYTTGSTAGAITVLSLQKMQNALEELRGIPPAKWLLIAPDGKMWTGDDPMHMAALARQDTYCRAMVFAPKEG